MGVIGKWGDGGGNGGKQKRFLVNGVPRRQVDFVNLRAVLFVHRIWSWSPEVRGRRRYLDL